MVATGATGAMVATGTMVATLTMWPSLAASPNLRDDAEQAAAGTSGIQFGRDYPGQGRRGRAQGESSRVYGLNKHGAYCTDRSVPWTLLGMIFKGDHWPVAALSDGRFIFSQAAVVAEARQECSRRFAF